MNGETAHIVSYLFADRRVDDWALMSSIYPSFGVVLLYLLACTVGPKLMENRKPWHLKKFMVAYNFSLVLLSLYMAFEVCAVDNTESSLISRCKV